jgi:hypothetical protein
MASKKLNFDEETKQFIALHTNIKGEKIEKIFTTMVGNQLIKPLLMFMTTLGTRPSPRRTAS